MQSLATADTSFDQSTPFWRHYTDADLRVEMEIPSQWIAHDARGYILELHAPDDPWTVLQLSHQCFDGLLFGERVNELLLEDNKRWAMQRRASLIHNGVAAIEADFSLQSNGASWLMRKLFLPHGDGLFALAFMTRLATWSRYSTITRGVYRSFSIRHAASRPKSPVVSERAPRAALHSDTPFFLL